MSSSYRPGLRVSEYLLEERIGAGSFAEVWRGRHHVWDSERVAIKLPNVPEYVRYLQREGVLVHGLKHPNIVRVLGLDPYADVPYLVMELVRGPALKQVLEQNPQGLPTGAAIVVLRGLLTAIATAHAANVLHRDIKPGTILLDLNGKPLNQMTMEDVKVSDFGLGGMSADMLSSIAQSASMARDDRIVGTLAYMAPELRDGAKKADARSDLYSAGVVLFELLTGERPAGGELPSSLKSGVPAALDEVFSRLYTRYERRYESAAAVLDDLNQRLTPPPPIRAAGRNVPPPPVRRVEALNCLRCGGRIEPDDQFCTQCGRQAVEAVRRCEGCGGFPAPRDRFCIFCGSELAPA